MHGCNRPPTVNVAGDWLCSDHESKMDLASAGRSGTVSQLAIITRQCARPLCPNTVYNVAGKHGRPVEYCSRECSRMVENAAKRAKRRRPDGLLWSGVPGQEATLCARVANHAKLEAAKRSGLVYHDPRVPDIWLLIERSLPGAAVNSATREIIKAPDLCPGRSWPSWRSTSRTCAGTATATVPSPS